MGRASNRKKNRQPDPDAIPSVCFRCSRCGRPWLREQASVIKGDALCFPCAEEFAEFALNARYQADRAAYQVAKEKARIDKARMDA